MKILLVRHGKTVAPRDWSGDAALRPLGDRGRDQAEAIRRKLTGEPLARILSGPALACQQTLEPLTIETDHGPAEDADSQRQQAAEAHFKNDGEKRARDPQELRCRQCVGNRLFCHSSVETYQEQVRPNNANGDVV